MPTEDHGSDEKHAGGTAPADCPVIVVDDDEAVLSVLTRTLEHSGYPVTAYTHPQEVLDGLPHEGVVVLVTDLEMPGMDGIELAERMLRAVPDLAVIVLTGGATARSAADAIRLGLVEYLQKPLGTEALAGAVEKAIEVRSRNILRRGQGLPY